MSGQVVGPIGQVAGDPFHRHGDGHGIVVGLTRDGGDVQEPAPGIASRSANDLSCPQFLQENIPGNDSDLSAHPFCSLIAHHQRLWGRVFLHECHQWTQIPVVHAAGPLDLDGDLASFQDEIDFQPRLGTPEIDLVIQPAVRGMGRHLGEDEMLERLSEHLSLFFWNVSSGSNCMGIFSPK